MRKFEEIGRIKVFLKDPNKKNIFRILKEVTKLMVLHRQFPFYYFKHAYKKNVPNYLDYLSAKEVSEIGYHPNLHKSDYHNLINNKLFFGLFCENTGIKTPKLVSYNLGSTFYFNGKKNLVSTKEDLLSFFEMVFQEFQGDGLFFRTPQDYGGKGYFKLTRSNFSTELSLYWDTILEGSYVHTEVIKQHPEMDQIHDKSLSTMRLVTLVTSEKRVEIVSALLRLGVGNSVVDNASSGGFFVGINLETGRLKEVGHFLLGHGGGEIYEHPDSKFRFGGFKIPYFKEACEAVKSAVQFIPDRFIGWDVAITDEGPIIIEANTSPHLTMSDLAYGGLRQNKHIRNLLEELKE